MTSIVPGTAGVTAAASMGIGQQEVLQRLLAYQLQPQLWNPMNALY